ncbi:hypothetical protein BDR06DRAFT_1014512 [Suillus hirtellus]|nr:hypothetical protein BDR06DRAFT_1014512 [Suillus hirtellus]
MSQVAIIRICIRTQPHRNFRKFLQNFPTLIQKLLAPVWKVFPKFPAPSDVLQTSLDAFRLSSDTNLKLRAHTRVRGAAHELKPSPSESVLPLVHGLNRSAAQATFIKKPSNSKDDSDQENDIADIKAQCLAQCGTVPPQRKTHNEAKQPAAAVLFDDDEPEYSSSTKTPTALLPQPVKPMPQPQPQPVVQESSDEDPNSIKYHALSSSTPSAKKTQSHTQITKCPQLILTDDEEHSPLSKSFLPPAKKIQSNSPLPLLTKDKGNKPSPSSPPPPMKPENQIVPCPAVLISLQPAAIKAQVSLKFKLALANQSSIEDKDITSDAPAVPKKKRKKTSSTEATRQNPPHIRNR